MNGRQRSLFVVLVVIRSARIPVVILNFVLVARLRAATSTLMRNGIGLAHVIAVTKHEARIIEKAQHERPV